MDTDVLEKLGLEGKEIKIYLALLKLGAITATQISKETRIERTLCYSIIEKLIDKGLVSFFTKKNVRYFNAASPNKLMEDVDERKRELNQLMPQLLGLQKLAKEETKIEVYKGKEGLRSLIKNLFESKTPYKVVGAAREFETLFPHMMEYYLSVYEKNKIPGKVLICQGEEDITPQKYEEWRKVPEDIQLPTSLLLFGDRVTQFIWEEPYFAIVMENKNIVATYDAYFDWLWRSSKVIKPEGKDL
ncbi:hypothetical protein HN698_00095 [Candidatus Woesearchaeota archaeon]|jgi:HTH-type transcriptional regulator, sugar sensing transcriptional regulator|nr:hypothetical protein [Candidatus Woesearchaeota archaeon]MBT4698162.1 hypothetical protein [Candidatus Woesearchaeota archaeon]MBT4716357.1 hypothetical protein [Candidatus Woesearchaeota archaeon]MBT7930301.1 hypothetical protein [Candidatus Woesearchaeota archaeon]